MTKAIIGSLPSIQTKKSGPKPAFFLNCKTFYQRFAIGGTSRRGEPINN
jgi:hypothetical protein